MHVLPPGDEPDPAGAGRVSRPVVGRVLVLGGARSGKSAEAERRLANAPAVTYVATARHDPDDPEWQARIAAHRTRRPAHWTTLETGELDALLRDPPTPLLIDCLTLWLTGVLDDASWGPIEDRVDGLADAWASSSGPVVAVSSEAGSGVVPGTLAGRRFRDELGALNIRLAAAADEVWLVVAGVPVRLR